MFRASIDYMVVGLGNPGSQYAGSRHNIGFDALDHLAQKVGCQVVRAKFSALTGRATVGGKNVLFLKPQTFMNLSGDAVAQAARFYKLPPQRCIVLYDDVALPVGKLRVRAKGSAGGHNGIKSIISHLGEEFPRVKIGVGGKPSPEADLASHVLSRLSKADRQAIAARFDDVAGAVETILQGDLAAAMSRYNG